MTRRVSCGKSQTGLSDPFPCAWKPVSNAGSHLSTATTAAGCLAATRINPAKIGLLQRTNYASEVNSFHNSGWVPTKHGDGAHYHLQLTRRYIRVQKGQILFRRTVRPAMSGNDEESHFKRRYSMPRSSQKGTPTGWKAGLGPCHFTTRGTKA